MPGEEDQKLQGLRIAELDPERRPDREQLSVRRLGHTRDPPQLQTSDRAFGYADRGWSSLRPCEETEGQRQEGEGEERVRPHPALSLGEQLC